MNTSIDIATALARHHQWLDGDGGGEQADLSGADLRCADLRCADLRCADLRGAYLSGANLRYADLRGANLIGANLIGANLSGAYLSGAYLSDANLRGANLSGATLNWQSHALISEILIRAAGGHVERRMVAGLIAVSTDWCWDRFMEIEHPEKQWAVDELALWVRAGDGAPELIQVARAAGGE